MASKEAQAIADCIAMDVKKGRKGREAYDHFCTLILSWQEQIDGAPDKEEFSDLRAFFSEMYPGILPKSRK